MWSKLLAFFAACGLAYIAGTFSGDQVLFGIIFVGVAWCLVLAAWRREE